MKFLFMFAIGIVAACSGRLAMEPPILVVRGDFDPKLAWPELELAPRIRCDGDAVLVPLETTYGGERSPVAAAILDRSGSVIRTIDLDAVTGFDVRSSGEVHRKVAEANAALSADCWQPLVLTNDIVATWSPPSLQLHHDGLAMEVRPLESVDTSVGDTNCKPDDVIRSVFVDSVRELGVIRIDHVMHDNCGSDPPTWIVVPLRFEKSNAFVCGLPSRSAFEQLLTKLTLEAEQRFGTCIARLDGERWSIYSGNDLVYSKKDGGSSWAYSASFSVENVRPGDDAEVVATAFARKGRRVRCRHDSEGDWCTFPALVKDECGEGAVHIRLRSSSATVPEGWLEPARLRMHTVAAVAVVMPC